MSTSEAYRVFVDDNYHFMDESERYLLGEFEDAEGAIAACKAVVDEGLRAAMSPNVTAEQLFASYKVGGEDPFIVAPPGRPSVEFSAWRYAEERCRALCTG
jgi:hypothetical protein